MVLRLEAVAFDVADPSAAAAFWAGLLDRPVIDEDGAVLVPGDRTQVGLRFVATERRRTGRPRLHVHVTSQSAEDQERTVRTALRLGGRHHDVGQTGAEGFVVLADPEGDELCVIEPGNAYLAGTGRLGEITCGGTRAVGLFWREALGWPLVWDEGEQTAIQSPLGGTKIAWDAWDEAAPAPADRRRERFDLTSTDLDADVGRLLTLGAARIGRLPRGVGRGVTMTDPDGAELSLRPA